MAIEQAHSANGQTPADSQCLRHILRTQSVDRVSNNSTCDGTHQVQI